MARDYPERITVNGRRIKAKRVFLREAPENTPAGQQTVPPRKYRITPKDGAHTAVKIGDALYDGELELTVTFIQPGPTRLTGQPEYYELRCAG